MDRVIIEILEQAGNQDPNIFKPAEQMLKQWETHHGFYTTLFASLCLNIFNKCYFFNHLDFNPCT
jgi:hypothetical protein